MPKDNIKQTRKLAEIHDEALQKFKQMYNCGERDKARNDRRFSFVAGAQWEGSHFAEQFANRPRLEFNKVRLSVQKIENEYKNNRIGVDFIARDGAQDSKLADTCDRLLRADEQDSDATEAYDNALSEQVAGGMGGWRLRAVFEDEFDEENDQQRIVIEPIYEADVSIFFDPNAKKADKSDAKYCFLITRMTLESYKEEYGDDPASWPSNTYGYDPMYWCGNDMVRVAEYYVIEDVKEAVFVYTSLDGEEEKYTEADFDNDEELQERLESIGTTLTRQRKITRRKVHKYVLSGAGVVEDAGVIAGKHIPIVVGYGQRCIIDNVEHFVGHVRHTIDAQMLHNMQKSKLAELAGISSTETPIMTPDMVGQFGTEWAERNLKNSAFLHINPTADKNGNLSLQPPAYTKVPQIPPAMSALIQETANDMKEVLGNTQEGEKLVPNTSAKAVSLVQNQINTGTFNYRDNMAKAMRRSGDIWLSMAKDIYVEDGRKMKGVGSRGDVGQVELKKPTLDDQTGATLFENDLSNAQFSVVSSVGPSFASAKESAINVLIQMLQYSQDPATVDVLTSMIMMNMEGEGIEDFNEFYRMKLVRLGVLKPTTEESQKLEQEAQNKPPDPQAELFLATAENETAKAAEARANTMLTTAKVGDTQASEEKKQAETIEILSNIGGGDKTAESGG